MTEPKTTNAQLVNRRDVASLIGTALGAFALAGCTQSAAASEAEPESTGATAAALDGTQFLWADTIADLRTLTAAAVGSAPTQPAVIVGGYHAPNDGGGGVFYWEDGVTTGDNGGTIIVPTVTTGGRWRRLFSGDVNVRWFGAVGDGTTNDAPAINATITAVNLTGGVVYLPPGSYKVTSSLTTLGAGVKLLGARKYSIYANSGTRILSYVTSGLSLLSLGSTGYVGNAVEHITFEQRITTGPGAGVTDPTFRQQGFAAIEAGTIGNAVIDHCSFHGFQFGVIFDGAEEVTIRDCIFSGGRYTLAGGPGYSAHDDYGVGIWLTRGPSRNNGNPYTGITNGNVLRNLNFYGGNIGAWVEDGLANALEHCRFHGGGTSTSVGILVGSVSNLSINDAYFEGSGYNPGIRRADIVSPNVAIGVTLINCIMGGATTSFDVDDTMYALACIGCSFGGPPGGYAFTGFAQVAGFSIQGCSYIAGLLDMADHPGAISNGFSQMASGPQAGVAVNKNQAAKAALDIRQTDTTRPLLRVHGSAYDLYRHSAPTYQKSLIEWISINPNSGGEGGAKRLVDTWHFDINGAAKDLAAWEMPDYSHAVFDVKVWQRQSSDPTKYMYAHKIRRAYRAGGGTVFLTTFDDVASTGPDAYADTDGNFAAPTLIVDGSGNVVVHVGSHPSAFSQVQVVVDVTLVKG